MLGVIRRVRDAFLAGRAEERFKALETETRRLLVELEHSLEKDALRRATAARRALREREKEEPSLLSPEGAAQLGADLGAELAGLDHKAAIRKRAAVAGIGIHRRGGGE